MTFGESFLERLLPSLCLAALRKVPGIQDFSLNIRHWLLRVLFVSSKADF